MLSHGGPDPPLSLVAEMPSAGPAKVNVHSSASGTSRNDSIKGAPDVEVVRVATTKDGGRGGESVRTGGTGCQGWEAV